MQIADCEADLDVCISAETQATAVWRSSLEWTHQGLPIQSLMPAAGASSNNRLLLMQKPASEILFDKRDDETAEAVCRFDLSFMPRNSGDRFCIVQIRYAPRFSYWAGLGITGVQERPEYGRAKATLAQVENP